MTASEKNIRTAAARLAEAILEGREAGLTVSWPVDAAGLTSLAISQTGKGKKAAPKPAPAK
jgi:hypothetical protein